MPAPELLASVEVCARVGIDRSTLTRWVQLGRATPAMRLPGDKGAMLFTPEEVERLAREYRRSSGEPESAA